MADANASVAPSLASLRSEASHLKDCYTRFSAQSIAIGAAANALILKFIWETPGAGTIAVFVMFLVFSAARVGTFKYGGANRIHGYELHLARVKHLQDSSGNGWRAHMTEIGWEEALRAWRIVQATMYRHVYYTDPSGPEQLNLDIKNLKYKWFEPSQMIHKAAEYHPGTYLKKTFDMLFLTAIIAWLFLPLMAALLIAEGDNHWLASSGAILLAVTMLMVMKARVSRLEARRVILEHGLLSIHSCAIAWQAVVVAHYRALRMLGQEHDSPYRDYSFALSLQANDLVDNVERIHEWVQDWEQSEVMAAWNATPDDRDQSRRAERAEPRSLSELVFTDMKQALWGEGVQSTLAKMLAWFRSQSPF